MVRRLLQFDPRFLPFMARANYLREVRTAATFPTAIAMTEGAFASVVAAKYFQAPPLVVALIVAAPMFGNIVAVIWADLAEKRRRVPFINTLQVGMVTCVMAVALTIFLPREVGAWVFALLILAARVITSGIVTVRSVAWRMNYPRHVRAQIVARIVVINSLVLAAVTTAAATAIDRVNWSYAAIYLVGGLISLAGIREFGRIRIRGEHELLRRERQAPPAPHGLGRLVEMIRDTRALLRQDDHFRTYQWWQMFLGASFLMMTPMLYHMVNREMTNPQADYLLATLVTHVTPLLTIMVFTPLWAPLFDRMRFASFRFMQSLVALSTHVLILVGAVSGQLAIVAAGTFVLGVSMAAGNLAWNLGQNAFAPPGQIQRYMGVHVMLTGARGCVAPFLAVGIYHALTGSGWERWVFVLPLLSCAIGVIGFATMSRGQAARRDDADVEQAVA